MTWKLSERPLKGYFFNLDSAVESARPSTSICFKRNLGFVFSANLVPGKSLQSVALRSLPLCSHISTYKTFWQPPAWSISPSPCPVTFNSRMMLTPSLSQIFWTLLTALQINIIPLPVTIKQQIKLVLRHSLCKNEKMNLMYWFQCCRWTVSSTLFSA